MIGNDAACAGEVSDASDVDYAGDASEVADEK